MCCRKDCERDTDQESLVGDVYRAKLKVGLCLDFYPQPGWPSGASDVGKPGEVTTLMLKPRIPILISEVLFIFRPGDPGYDTGACSGRCSVQPAIGISACNSLLGC